ncbi:MAG: agmatinase [Candidatus Methylomirabilales bacterium]
MMRRDSPGVILFGAPLDLTSSFRSGARFGPQQIREAGEGLEDYSFSLGRNIREMKLSDQGDLELPPENLEKALARIEESATAALAKGMPCVALGGEHLITLPLVKAALAKYPDLLLLQVDAHADLAESYGDEPLTHATVIRRIVELLGPGRAVQVGIRSATAEEVAFAREQTHLFPGPPAEVGQILTLLRGRPVYLTIDMDVVDPAFAPGVSTPEPGGWSSNDLFQVLSQLADLEVVGMDLVEVCPPYDPAGVTATLAAKVLREALLTLFYPD